MVKWSTIKIVAIKPHTYGTRHLTAGEEYELRSEEAIAQVALRNADFAKPSKKPKEPEPVVAHVEEQTPATAEIVEHHEPEPAAPEPHHENHEHTEHAIDRLRLEATSLGINVDGRWGIARLRHEIAMAKR